jgi:hypothetical protein
MQYTSLGRFGVSRENTVRSGLEISSMQGRGVLIREAFLIVIGSTGQFSPFLNISQQSYNTLLSIL